MSYSNKTIALCGNPNVGKSTAFNALTGLKQHTGNWAGKRVEDSYGSYKHNGAERTLVDLPGIYSYSARSNGEEIARDFIDNKSADVVVVICDAVCLERNLHIALRTIQMCDNVIVALNMIDEAEKRKIIIDTELLEKELNTKIVCMSARNGVGINKLKDTIEEAVSANTVLNENEKIKMTVSQIYDRANEICRLCVKKPQSTRSKRQLMADKLLTNKYLGIPVMVLFLALILFLTIFAANYPSKLLSDFLLGIEDDILNFVLFLKAPEWLAKMLVEGGYRVLAYVVSVMLPPTAIFFALFTLLEDLGYLPRVAFNLDGCFKKCNACGKQALTMCMGLGCNAVGVTGCRIIDSKRERLIAILTNSFMPCNGRFPTLIAVITMFLTVADGGIKSSFFAAGVLALFIVLAVIMTFLVSKLLSKTLLKGAPSSFTLELPPYRCPQLKKVIVHSILNKTLNVLARAAMVSFPAGIVLWIMANVNINGISIFSHLTSFLEPFSRLMGLDGVILLAFIMALPANETVMPIIIMGYMAASSISEVMDTHMLHEILASNGWNVITAICVMTFTLFHWPCSTTLLTIKKETGSVFWTFIATITPTNVGIVLCMIIAFTGKIIF